MSSITELLTAVKAQEEELRTQLKVLQEKREQHLIKSRAWSNASYARKRAKLLSDPDYVKPKKGRPHPEKVKVEEPQADEVSAL